MRKKNFKGRCEKRQVSASEDVCRTYDDIQRAYMDKLEANKSIKSIRCNVPLKGPTVEEYTTDFVCIRVDGEMMVRECVFRRFLTKYSIVQDTGKLLLPVSPDAVVGKRMIHFSIPKHTMV